MANNNIGAKIFSQSFNSRDIEATYNKIVSVISKETGKAEDEIKKEIDNLNFGEDLQKKIIEEFEKAEKKIGGKSFSFSKDLFKGLFDSKGSEEEINKVVKIFENKIESIINLKNRIGDDNIFANMMANIDTKQLDELIEKEREFLKLEQERQNLTGANKSRVTRQRNSLDKELNASVEQIKIDFDVDSGKINEANKALEKYNVSQDEALKKAKELSKQRSVASSYIDKDNIDDIKDMIAYMQRYIELVKQAGGTEDEALKNLRSEVGPANVRRLTGASGDTGYLDYKDEIQSIRTEISTLNQEARGIGGQVFDDSKLKEQEQEINKLTESLEKTQVELDSMSQKYKEQTDLVSELRKQTQALEGINDPKVMESDEYKKLTEELRIAESKASEFQNELEFAEETAERLRRNLNAYNTGDVVPREQWENASSLVELLNNKIDELKTSLTEAEQRTESLSNQMNALQQDNTSLNEQLSQQKQINEAQKEQISNLEKTKSELENYRKQYQELLNTIKEIESAQQRAMSLADNAGRIEAFNSATRNVGYNEGIDTPEGFVNFDYLDKAKQKLEETGNKYEKLIKAAVYYNQYLEKGGTEKIFNADGKDISEQLISVYKEMSNMAKENGEISQQSAIQTVKDLNNELIVLRSKSSELEENCKKLEKQLKLQKEISKQSAQIKPTEEITTGSSNANVMSREELRQQMMEEQEKKRKQSTTPQVDHGNITSEQQTLEKLEQAINSVKDAITKKTKAIKEEETQMSTSVNNEIAKLQELESKLTEIKTQFQNGILSKNPDGGDNITLEKDVNLKPTYDADKFKKDAEGLLAHADVEKEVTLKVGDLDLSANNQATEDIKEQIKSATGNVDLSDSYNPNQFDELLSKDFNTKGKKDATSQLREAYNEFKQYYDDLDKLNTTEGQKAAYNYYKAYDEALKQRISKINLNRYSTDDTEIDIARYYKPDIYDEEIKRSNLDDQINIAERSLKLFSKVQNELGNIKIDDSIAESVSKLAYNLNELEKVKSDLDNNVSRPLFDDNLNIEYSMEATKKDYEELSDTVSYFETILKSEILYAKEFGETLSQSAQKAESAISEVNDELNKPQKQTQSDKGKNGSQVQDGEKKNTNNLLGIQLEPVIDEKQWIIDINDIINSINQRKAINKVQIQPDTSSNEWNEFKTFIKNISDQVIKLNLQMNEDGSVTKKKSTTLSSDLNKSYQNSTKYANELYKIKEQIAKATESNNKKELEKLATLKAQQDEFEELLRLEKEFRANDRFSDFDTNSKDDALNKLMATKEQEYLANRSIAASSLTSRMASIEDEAWKANEAYDQNKKLEEVNRLLDLQREKWQEINNIRIKMESESGFDDDQIDLDILEQQKKALMEEVELIQEQLKQYDSLIDKKKESKKLDAITTDANKTINGGRVVDLDQAYNEANKINEALIKTENMMNRFMNGVNRNDSLFGEAFENAKNDISEFNRQLESGEITLSQYNKLVNDLKKNLSIQKDTVAIVDPEDISNIEQIRDVLKRYMDEATNGTAENLKWNDSARTLTGTFKNQNGEIQNVTTAIKDLNNGTSAVTTSFGKAQKPISNWSKLIDELGVKFRNLATYLASFVGFYEIWGAIKQGVTYVRELDTALTEMRKVSDETITSLREFQEASFDVADSIGATAKEISNSTADFMRLGYSLDEASSLAKDANIYANVGDMEIDEATEHMISSIKAWGSEFSSEVEASEAIIDRYNEIGNNFAISSADIGSAMERSGAALKAAGNDLNESLGLIVSGNLIQQDADVTAAALRTMSLRIRGASSELEDLGEETDGMATSTAKLREEIKALSGVDIMLDDETFKSTAEIIKELGAVWEDLSDITQANILEQIAGKNRASTVAGLLENYELIDEVIETAENATGSAAKENEAYLESIDGKLDQLTNKVQEFWDTFIDTDIVKAVIDFLTNLINLATDFVDTIGAFPILMTTVVAAISKFSGAKLFTGGGRAKYL